MEKIVRFHRQRKTGWPKDMANQKTKSAKASTAKPAPAKPAPESFGQILMFTGVRYEHNGSLRYENAAKKPVKNG